MGLINVGWSRQTLAETFPTWIKEGAVSTVHQYAQVYAVITASPVDELFAEELGRPYACPRKLIQSTHIHPPRSENRVFQKWTLFTHWTMKYIVSSKLLTSSCLKVRQRRVRLPNARSIPDHGIMCAPAGEAGV